MTCKGVVTVGCEVAGWDGQARCPFYSRADKKKHRIICEGISPGSRVNLVFLRQESERVEHLTRFCCGAYERCPLYGAIYQQYEVEAKR